ncbi:MAG: hypothetical protein PHF84_09760 [bacterium]|nr:hypothetical protein [bacterium]
MKNIFQIIIILLYFQVKFVQSAESAGTGQMLSPDARMAGLAGSFDALSDSVDSVYYNPAGLGMMENIMFNGSYMPGWDTLTSVYYFSAAFPNQVLPFGIGYCNVDSGGIPVRDSSPEIVRTADFRNINTFVSGAYALAPGLSFGLRVRVNYVSLYTSQDWGAGADLAFLWRRPDPYSFTKSSFLETIQPISFGLVLYNLYSSGIRLKDSVEKSPMILKAGLSYRFRTLFKFLEPEPGLGMEGIPEYKTWLFSAGLDLVFWDIAFLRAGYKISENVFTMGTGVNVWDMTLDFSLSFLPLSSNFYNLNLKIKFN